MDPKENISIIPRQPVDTSVDDNDLVQSLIDRKYIVLVLT